MSIKLHLPEEQDKYRAILKVLESRQICPKWQIQFWHFRKQIKSNNALKTSKFDGLNSIYR